MSPFRFRLARLLEIRERVEREQAGRLAAAQGAADDARAAERALAEQRAAGRDALAARDVIAVGQLHNMTYVLEQLDVRLDAAARDVARAEDVVQRAEVDLREAFRARRVLDRLRERHHDEWRAAASAEDRASMDAIALTRFTHRASDSASAERP